MGAAEARYQGVVNRGEETLTTRGERNVLVRIDRVAEHVRTERTKKRRLSEEMFLSSVHEKRTDNGTDRKVRFSSLFCVLYLLKMNCVDSTFDTNFVN